MTDGIFIGYGFNRDERDFAHTKCERLFLDYDGKARIVKGRKRAPDTERVFRDDLIEMGLRPGDTLVVLDMKDLGQGNHLKVLERMGNPIVVDPLEVEPAKLGRPYVHAPPTREQFKRLRLLWTGPRKIASVLEEASQIMGRDISRDDLRNMTGQNRDGTPRAGLKRKKK
ncbi:MAG: hypothetical protein AAGI12_15900 [Pseudomonadota bacterium]